MNVFGYVEWTKTKNIKVVCEDTGKELTLEYRRYNTLYSKELDRELWFNNALTLYAFLGLCLYICVDEITSIMDKYDVIGITTEEEED